MSSLARRLQIRIWKKMAKKPFNHTSNHHARLVGDPKYGVFVGAAWPLLANQLKPEEVSS